MKIKFHVFIPQNFSSPSPVPRPSFPFPYWILPWMMELVNKYRLKSLKCGYIHNFFLLLLCVFNLLPLLLMIDCLLYISALHTFNSNVMNSLSFSSNVFLWVQRDSVQFVEVGLYEEVFDVDSSTPGWVT